MSWIADADWTVAQQTAIGFVAMPFCGPECQHTRHRLRDPGEAAGVAFVRDRIYLARGYR
jgi:hypothetical protein